MRHVKIGFTPKYSIFVRFSYLADAGKNHFVIAKMQGENVVANMGNACTGSPLAGIHKVTMDNQRCLQMQRAPGFGADLAFKPRGQTHSGVCPLIV
jgi:hypothetical protein